MIDHIAAEQRADADGDLERNDHQAAGSLQGVCCAPGQVGGQYNRSHPKSETPKCHQGKRDAALCTPEDESKRRKRHQYAGDSERHVDIRVCQSAAGDIADHRGDAKPEERQGYG
ncbi:hypothetical protein AMC84_CH01124 [Rhizobium phaseoli]|nr:hypothetical protein AMC84_CH01124 [Rhizobium phaseoli]